MQWQIYKKKDIFQFNFCLLISNQSVLISSPIRNDQLCVSNARDLSSTSVAQFTYLRMLGVPITHEIDNAEESYNIYSQFQLSQDLDLYDQLLHQPANLKKPSILYDYSPPQATLLTSAEQEPEIFLEPMKRSSNSSQTQIYVRKCTCSKTRCQKNYCECFKQGVACSSACECVSCCNKEKLFSAKSSLDGKGCSCQKSKCQKNYCECHLNGKRCNASCKCIQCENMDLPQDCLELGKSKPNKRRKTNDSY